jgi:prepilin-type N-terminal cleavage/methylation domain-containing protein
VRSVCGFTLVEVIVSVCLLGVGLLGLAAGTGLATRMIGQGRRDTAVAALAAERIEMLRGRSCGDLAGGAATRGAYQISWTVAPAASLASVVVIVVSPAANGSRADTFSTVMPC